MYHVMFETMLQRAIATCKEDASQSGPLTKSEPNTAPTPQWCEQWSQYMSKHFAGAAAASIVAVTADGKSYTVETTAAAAFVKQVRDTHCILLLLYKPPASAPVVLHVGTLPTLSMYVL
jgi:hypothetical protein